MSTVRESEKARGMAHEKHRQAKKRLEKALVPVGAIEPNPRVVQPLLTKMEEAFESLMEAHVNFVLKKNAGLQEAAHAHWMDERQTEHDAAVDAANLLLGYADETGAPPVV